MFIQRKYISCLSWLCCDISRVTSSILGLSAPFSAFFVLNRVFYLETNKVATKWSEFRSYPTKTESRNRHVKGPAHRPELSVTYVKQPWPVAPLILHSWAVEIGISNEQFWIKLLDKAIYSDLGVKLSLPNYNEEIRWALRINFWN